MSEVLRTRVRAFRQLCLARLRESYREPEVLFWGFVFPVLLTATLAVAFRSRPPEPSRAVVLAGPGVETVHKALAQAPLLKAEVATELEAARAARRPRRRGGRSARGAAAPVHVPPRPLSSRGGRGPGARRRRAAAGRGTRRPAGEP